MPDPTQSKVWPLLRAQHERISKVSLRELFTGDPGRAERYSIEACGMLLDYSRHGIDDETLRLLLEFAREQGLPARTRALFSGEKINLTEGRAALHTALRASDQAVIAVDGVDVMPAVREVRRRVYDFATRVRSGAWRGCTGEAMTDVVNIGIGGSDLGPRMACNALAHYGDGRLAMHFVSNVDGAQLARTLRTLRPETTLFVIASKTFTTQETLTNARAAREWLAAKAGEEAVARHFVAVSTNARAVARFGIDTANMFEFWDWVGGRYSLWSAIGLAIVLQVGPERYDEFLAGARAMDAHFRDTPPERNLPVILALLGIWYADIVRAPTRLVAPYNESLSRLPAYLQQLEMESNGKSVSLDGQPVDYATSPVVWGESAINGQHAYFQLVHQGTQLIPIDFIAAMENPDSPPEAHAILIANCLAQAEALMRGKTAGEVRQELAAGGIAGEAAERLIPHKVFAGNRPSSTLLLDRVDPGTLGALIALYEHKVFVQGTLWNVNSFDQWGVELGKQLASTILSELGGAAPSAAHDASTARLIAHCRRRIRSA